MKWCYGGRDTGVISSMSHHTNTNIIAMADLFSDKPRSSKIELDECNTKNGFPNIKKSNAYIGSNVYPCLLENKDGK